MKIQRLLWPALLWVGIVSLAKADFTLSLGGTAEVFYPVHFRDTNWDEGAFDLNIHRSNVHLDGTWFGSLIVNIRSHSSAWGHGADFLETDVHWGGQNGSLIAGVVRTYYSCGVVVWLRGARTYYYNSNHGVEVVENSAVGSELVLYENAQYNVREAYQVKTAIDPAFELNGRRFENNVQIGGSLGIMGNVGVGTNTPSHKLSVNGAVRAKEVIVDTGWSDYVFAPDYELAPLTEVEAHIKEHRHLPGIPSAAEVAEHGVSVGEMQAKLLAKIEELTLHVIAQEKAFEGMKQENASLKVRVTQLEAKATP